MNWKNKILLPLGISLTGLACTNTSTALDNAPATGISLPALGKVQSRSAKEIASSSWSIGGETIDRDFTVYENYKQYLGPLGAKSIRLQAGWAKCEKTQGVYSWEWLDAIVNDATGQGVRPWLQLSYGNPIYAGGGDTGLGGGLPSSPEAIAAWKRWVRAVIGRYGDRVNEWEIWNEPDINSKGTAPVAAYTDLYIETASIVRELQPKGRVYALALANKPVYAEQFLAAMNGRHKLDLIDAITIHGYPRNPDDTSNLDTLQAMIGKYGHPIEIRQGESGAPSKFQANFALSKMEWSENTQTKWDLRRMLAHRARDVAFNLFTMVDMHYTQYHRAKEADDSLRMNYKGLLGTNPDQSISHVKPAYYAVQSVFAIFDDKLRRLAQFPFSTTATRPMALTGYTRQPNDAQIVALWFKDAMPAEDNSVTPTDITLPKGKFTEPVLVDLRTSTVFSLPKSQWSQDANGTTFRALPVYDSPILVAERSAITLAR